MKKIAIVGVAALLAPLTLAVPASAAVKSWKTCSALQKTYPYGAGVKAAKDKVKKGFSPATNFKVVSKAVYDASKKLDSDKDKILCEIPKYKNCTTANKTYKNGAGIKGAKDKSAKPVTTFKVVAANIYNTNKHLDRDKDKIFCEKL